MAYLFLRTNPFHFQMPIFFVATTSFHLSFLNSVLSLNMEKLMSFISLELMGLSTLLSLIYPL